MTLTVVVCWIPGLSARCGTRVAWRGRTRLGLGNIGQRDPEASPDLVAETFAIADHRRGDLGQRILVVDAKGYEPLTTYLPEIGDGGDHQEISRIPRRVKFPGTTEISLLLLLLLLLIGGHVW